MKSKVVSFEFALFMKENLGSIILHLENRQRIDLGKMNLTLYDAALRLLNEKEVFWDYNLSALFTNVKKQ